MKIKYIILIILILVIILCYSYAVLAKQSALHPQLDDLLQGVGVLVALLAAVIALSAIDRKAKQLKADIFFQGISNVSEVSKDSFGDQLNSYFVNYPPAFNTCRVNFKIKNKSEFTLIKPFITISIPADRKHPVQHGVGVEFRSNMFNSFSDIKTLENEEIVILSNNVVPFLNAGDEFQLWVRVSIKNKLNDSFNVAISINCDNAEGITYDCKVVIDNKT